MQHEIKSNAKADLDLGTVAFRVTIPEQVHLV